MDSEIQLPLSLVETMNDDASLISLRAFGSTSERTLGGALQGDALWDNQRASFVRRLESRELQRVVDEFRQRNKGNEFWDNFTVNDCSWEFVDDQLQQIEFEYTHANIVRRALRGGAVNSLRPLVEGIPDENGLGFLKAAIVILLDAVKRRSQACKIILDCFREIPQLVQSVENTLGRFSRNEDHEIYCCATRLYSAMVENLPPLIDHLLRHSDQSKVKKYGNMVKSVVVDEVATVNKHLQPITAARLALKKRESRLTLQRNDDMAKQVGEIHSEARALRRNEHEHHHEDARRLTAIDFTTGRSLQQGSRIESKLDAVVDILGDRVAHLESVHEKNAKLTERVVQLRINAGIQDWEIAQLKERLKIRSSFHLISEETGRNQRYCREASRQQHLSNMVTTFPSVHPIQNLNELIQIICNREESTYHVTDLYSILGQYQEFSEKHLAQAAYLSEKPQFRHWLMEQGPGSLLVDGHCGEHMNSSMSPLSVFCATLYQSLLGISRDSTDASAVLYFFCGYHLDPNGPLYGPQGLLRSLAAQVTLEMRSRQIQPDLQFLLELPYLADYAHPEDIDIRAMCRIFTGLLDQLPLGTTVYCVIDGVSQFEAAQGGMAENMRIIVACLQWCVLDADASVSVKLMLASADASTVVRHQIPRYQHVDLSSGDFHELFVSPPALMRELSNQFQFSPGSEHFEPNKARYLMEF